MSSELVAEALAWLVPRELDLGVVVSYAIVALALAIGGSDALASGVREVDRRWALRVAVVSPVWPLGVVALVVAIVLCALRAALSGAIAFSAALYRMARAAVSPRGRHRSRTVWRSRTAVGQSRT